MHISEAIDVAISSIESDHLEASEDSGCRATLARDCNCRLSLAYRRLKLARAELKKSLRLDRKQQLGVLKGHHEAPLSAEEQSILDKFNAEQVKARSERGKANAALRWSQRLQPTESLNTRLAKQAIIQGIALVWDSIPLMTTIDNNG